MSDAAATGERASGAIAAMIRVDHAGEFGAVRIYDGQLAVLGDKPVGAMLRHMRMQEREHLATFAGLLSERRVRPTALMPLWHIGGFALGAVTALLGETSAMACTEAVEDSVIEHYERQLAAMPKAEPALLADIARIRDEEREHGDQAIDAGARRAPGYRFLYQAIRLGCRTAIRLSEKI